MNRRQKVELFEQIRREYEFGVGTMTGVARQSGVHRRLVRQALQSAWPPERRRSVRSCPRLTPAPPHHPEQGRAQHAGRAGAQFFRPQRQAHHAGEFQGRFRRPLALTLLGALGHPLQARRQVVG